VSHRGQGATALAPTRDAKVLLMPRIQVLFFSGCPHASATVDLVRRTAIACGLSDAVESIRVDTQEDAARHRFIGSPTVRVDGEDIEPAARRRTHYTLACRLYGASGVPASELIVDAIRNFRP